MCRAGFQILFLLLYWFLKYKKMLKLCILMVAEKQFLNLILGKKKSPNYNIGTWPTFNWYLRCCLNDRNVKMYNNSCFLFVFLKGFFLRVVGFFLRTSKMILSQTRTKISHSVLHATLINFILTFVMALTSAHRLASYQSKTEIVSFTLE